MAYDKNFPPTLRIAADTGPQLFTYQSKVDAIATIAAANYFSNAQIVGMQLSDLIFIQDSLNTANIYYVSALSVNGATLTKASGGSSGGTGVPVNVTASAPILAGATGNTYSNNGAGGSVVLTLPASSVGIGFSMYVAAAQNFEFLAVGADIIKNGGDAGGASGNIKSSTVGNYINIQCLVAGIWSVTNMVGDWTLT